MSAMVAFEGKCLGVGKCPIRCGSWLDVDATKRSNCDVGAYSLLRCTLPSISPLTESTHRSYLDYRIIHGVIHGVRPPGVHAEFSSHDYYEFHAVFYAVFVRLLYAKHFLRHFRNFVVITRLYQNKSFDQWIAFKANRNKVSPPGGGGKTI